MLSLPAVFTDHAVIQRHQAIPVWGWTTPCTKVTATFNGVSACTYANDHGRFDLRLAPQQAGGPYTLSVEAGEDTITLKDIMVGEVWVASGQSNMEWTLTQCEASYDLPDPGENPIRMLSVPHTRAHLGIQADVKARWEIYNKQSCGHFSAVGTHFAQRLSKELNVTIGILFSAWGGTFIEAWTSRETLVRNPDTRHWVERYDLDSHDKERLEDLFSDPYRGFTPDPGNMGLEKGWNQPEFDDSSWNEVQIPRQWQMLGYNFNGILWFRKEIEIPESWVGRNLTLEIGAVDKQDISYFNGVEVGRTGEGFDESFWCINRSYPVSQELVTGTTCTIAVRAYSFFAHGGLIGPERAMKIYVDGQEEEPVFLAGTWRCEVELDAGIGYKANSYMGHTQQNSPAMLYNNMMAPLIPYGIRGVIWYQGESNAENRLKARRYERLMQDMIQDWRYHWGQGDFPFIIVQLANFRDKKEYDDSNHWPYLRENQLRATQALSDVGMAVIIDAGEANDIHPRDKATVGRRLAQWALAKTYQQEIQPNGPVYQSITVDRKFVRLTFSDTKVLSTSDGGPVRTLMIAGMDQEFKPAQSKIEGSVLKVWHDEMDAPEAVRYGWADNPVGCNLINEEGLPATPFRTDTW